MYRRSKQAQSVVEMVAGTMILVPLVLFLLDIGTLVVANYINDDYCCRAARAAASQKDKDAALASVKGVLSKLQTSQIITNMELMDPIAANPTPSDDIDFDNKVPGTVIVSTRIAANLPVPIPFLPDTMARFVTRSSLPITSKKAD